MTVATVCLECGQSRVVHRGSLDVPECPLPDALTCPECIDYWKGDTAIVSRFAAVDTHNQHEPSRRERTAHTEWESTHPYPPRRFGRFAP